MLFAPSRLLLLSVFPIADVFLVDDTFPVDDAPRVDDSLLAPLSMSLFIDAPLC